RRSFQMSQIYRAVLRGNQVEWIGAPPDPDGPTEVEITLLKREPESEEARRARRQIAVNALAELAAAGGFVSIPDPAAWEREIRRDRPLPGRED
ncbi:MAG TPA: hypothetical protein VK358_09055, partial [Longimicrobium sp.]|nr:hypothetical protein [Longimicrobium sp.]